MVYLTKQDKINAIKRLFNTNFIIKDFVYDFSKFYTYKLVLVADKKGVLKKNKYLDFEIEIIDKKINGFTSDYTSINLEVSNLSVLNHCEKKISIRIGMNVVFYFTDVY